MAEKVHISLFFGDFFLSDGAYFFPISLFFPKSLIFPPPRGLKRPEYPPLLNEIVIVLQIVCFYLCLLDPAIQQTGSYIRSVPRHLQLVSFSQQWLQGYFWYLSHMNFGLKSTAFWLFWHFHSRNGPKSDKIFSNLLKNGSNDFPHFPFNRLDQYYLHFLY